MGSLMSLVFRRRQMLRTSLFLPERLDGDWVPDIIEHRLGTELFRADSDGDGRTDGEEIPVDNADPLRR